MELFRPLAGVNYNAKKVRASSNVAASFRPLAGVNYNRPFTMSVRTCIRSFRPLAGVNYNPTATAASSANRLPCFRPLAGVNYNLVGEPRINLYQGKFPSPCGGEL